MARKHSPISRRKFLQGSSAAVAGSGLGLTFGARATDTAGSTRSDNGSGTVFQHSVASGDPTQRSVIIWTRLTGVRERGVQPVQWEVAGDESFQGIVASGERQADPERDYTVKVDVTGLQAGTRYWYRFRFGNDASPVGRTNTLPANPEAVRFAIVSCSSMPHGLFNAYRSIAETHDWGGMEPTVVLHLGDYIYEYAFGEYGDARETAPEHEIYRLEDYRDRHAQYKQDADLQALHLKYPMINIWDDHETADNSWKEDAHNHGGGEEGSAETREVGDEEGGVLWLERKNAGRRAFFEWMPIRPVGNQFAGKADAELTDDELDEKYRIWRTFSLGGLADLIMLDTRLQRNSDEAENQADLAAINDPERRLLGKGGQEEWLFGDGTSGELGNSQATWQLLGQQIMVGQLHVVGTPAATPQVKGGVIFNTDQWDGWQSSRDQLYDAIEAKNAAGGNIVVLTGDIHTSWAMDITRDPNNPAVYDPFTGRGSIAVEFVCTSVTSPGLPELMAAQDAIRVSNPHMKYIDLDRKGYMVLDVSQTRVSGTWYYVDTIESPSTNVTAGPTFYVEAGQGKHYLLRDGGIPGVPEASGHEPS